MSRSFQGQIVCVGGPSTERHSCWCLQGQLCGLCLWFWLKWKMRMILQIKMMLQKWRCKNDIAKWRISPNNALASRADGIISPNKPLIIHVPFIKSIVMFFLWHHQAANRQIHHYEKPLMYSKLKQWSLLSNKKGSEFMEQFSIFTITPLEHFVT